MTSHPNAFLNGIWLFPEGAPVGEEAVMRGKWNDRALGYWPCGLAMHLGTEVLTEALPRASLGVGPEGLVLGWEGRQVAREGGQAGSIVAALFAGRRPLPPAYDFCAAAQPERAGEFLERLRRAEPNTILALGIRGVLGRPFAKELREVLRSFGLHASLPGEGGGCGVNKDGVEQFFFLSVKGLLPYFAVELDGEAARFPMPPSAQPGLLAHWRLDEGGGTRVNDSSGRGFHAELTGGRWIGQGEAGCLEFDGTGLVAGPSDPAFDLRDEVTISFWARPKEGPERHMFLAGRGDPGRSYGFWWHKNDWSFWQVNRHGYQIMGVGHGATPLETWAHLAGVVAGQEGILYLNGREVGRCKRWGLPALTGCPFTLGGFNNTWHPPFRGQLRDVRVYNRALSAQEIRGCLEEGRPGPGHHAAHVREINVYLTGNQNYF
jgi:hypothetical protein